MIYISKILIYISKILSYISKNWLFYLEFVLWYKGLISISIYLFHCVFIYTWNHHQHIIFKYNNSLETSWFSKTAFSYLSSPATVVLHIFTVHMIEIQWDKYCLKLIFVKWRGNLPAYKSKTAQSLLTFIFVNLIKMSYSSSVSWDCSSEPYSKS